MPPEARIGIFGGVSSLSETGGDEQGRAARKKAAMKNASEWESFLCSVFFLGGEGGAGVSQSEDLRRAPGRMDLSFLPEPRLQ